MNETGNDGNAPHVVILGAGHGGGALVAQLRRIGHSGPITVVGAENHLPYERPPLSKSWLTSDPDRKSVTLRPAEFYRDARITLRLGEVATRIDRLNKTLVVRRDDNDGDEAIAYDVLVIATGARPRRLALAGADASNVHYLRSQLDSARLRKALRPGARLVVVGGGYIGLEVAAAARSLDIDVTVVEQQPRLLRRTGSAALAEFVHRRHAAKGVRICTATTVTALHTESGDVTGVELLDDELLPCDVVVAGVGAAAVTELAAAAGLACADGIIVDERAQTDDPAIYAIGDATTRPVPHHPGTYRLESVPSTLEQVRQAANAIAGQPVAGTETPWFWSDQYDMKIQIVGICRPEHTSVVRADGTGITIAHLDGDYLAAIETVNRPGDFMIGKKLLHRRRPIDVQKIMDPATSLRDLAAAAVR